MILLTMAVAALTAGEIADRAPASAWRPVAPENLMLVESARGVMAIELAPDFAPAHIEAIRKLVEAGQFDGGAVTRVQDNYVVQWAARPGPGKVLTSGGANAVAKGAVATPGGVAVPTTGAKAALLPAEYERPLQGLKITPLGSPDSYAPSGFAGGWPVAQDKKAGTAWLAHCYGSVGVGRDSPPDTGDGSELYAVIGHGPRHLDRNITVVGRVIEGLPGYSSLPRGGAEMGFYEKPGEQTVITRVRLANTVPDAPRFEVMDTGSATFAAYKDARANRTGFFVRPSGAVDLCNVQVPVRRAK